MKVDTKVFAKLALTLLAATIAFYIGFIRTSKDFGSMSRRQKAPLGKAVCAGLIPTKVNDDFQCGFDRLTVLRQGFESPLLNGFHSLLV